MFRERKIERFIGFRRHLLNARKEVLLGARSMIDSRIRSIEKRVDELGKVKKKGEKMPAEPA